MPDNEQKDTYGSLGGEAVTIKEWIDCLAGQLEKTMRERPLLSLAMAAAAGYLLASFRRR